jgi:hypothetical protein
MSQDISVRRIGGAIFAETLLIDAYVARSVLLRRPEVDLEK